MNEKPHVDVAGEDRCVDRVERQLDSGEFRLIQPEGQIRRGERTGHGDAGTAHVGAGFWDA